MGRQKGGQKISPLGGGLDWPADLLKARFGTLPHFVTSYIASSSDSNVLRKLTLSAYHAESLQAVIDQIKKDDTKLM